MDVEGVMKTILLVEDEAILAMATSRKLRSYGFIVVTAGSGEQAVQMATESGPDIDLILMDIDLGKGMDGPEAAQRILRIKTVPVVFLTSHAEREMVEKVRGITRYGYVIKDSGDFVLRSSIEMALDLFEAHSHIQRSKETTEKYLDNAAAIVLIMDGAGNVSFINDGGRRLLGYAAGELAGKNWVDSCIPEGDRPYMRKLYALMMEGASDSFTSHENRIVTKDGRVKDILWHNSRLRDPDGRLSGFLCSGMEITAYNLTELALADATERLELAQQASSIGVWDWNVATGSIEWTAQMFELFGLDREKDPASFEAWRRVLHPDDLAAAEKRIAEALAARIELRNMYRIVRPDGQVRWIQAVGKGMYDGDGTPVRMIGVCIDITEHKQTEMSLRESNDYLDNLFNYANAPIVVWDPAFRITRFNHAFESLTGLGSAEVVGRTIDTLFPPSEAEATMEKIRDTTTGKRWESEEIGIMRRDGSVRTVLWNSAAIIDPVRKLPTAIIAQGQDITRRKRAEEALQKAYGENRNLLAELQHRAKNSFNLISGMIQLAADTGKSPETTAALRDLELRVRSVSELYSLLYSTGSFNEVRLDDYCVKIATPLIGLTSDIDLVSDLENITVTAKTAAAVGLIVTELMTNAVKYAFPDGRQGTIRLSIRRTPAGVLLELQDDGIGLPEDFDPELNTGMGILLVRGLAEQIGGSFGISADSAGTRCIVEFATEENHG